MSEFLQLDFMCSSIIDCPHSTPKWRENGVRVIRNFNISDGTLDFQNASWVDEATYKERTQRAAPEAGDIVISREAPMGAVALIPKGLRCCLGQRLVLLKVNKEICNPYYLLYAMQSQYVQAQIAVSDKTGSIVSNLNIPDLKELRIPYVNKAEQDKMVNVLFLINEKIALNKRINTELEVWAKTIYDYWFVQFDFPDENGKPYRSSGGKMVWNEQVKREIPEGWEVEALGRMVSLKRGISYTSAEITDPSGVPMFNLASIDKNRKYRPDELKYYSGKIDEAKTVNSGDMLIACTDLTREAEIIGSPILSPIDNATFSMDLARISSNDKALLDLYLFMSLRQTSYHNYIKRYASGTNVLHLDLDGINWYSCVIPPINIQKVFSDIICHNHKKISNILAENKELTSLRDCLLPMLMNGQATVRDNENTTELVIPFKGKVCYDQRFDLWLQNQGLAARGDIDGQTLREIFDVMDDDDK